MLRIPPKIIKTTAVIFLFLRFTILSPAEGSIKEKLNLIEIEIKKMGYKPNWVVISEKRSNWADINKGEVIAHCHDLIAEELAKEKS